MYFKKSHCTAQKPHYDSTLPVNQRESSSPKPTIIINHGEWVNSKYWEGTTYTIYYDPCRACPSFFFYSSQI